MKEYITINDYCREIFGCKVYKIALSCSTTCPNRDGSKGFGGCIFCSAVGSGDFAADFHHPVSVQIENAIKRLGKKGKGCKYIAYFQSFTSTYGDIQEISKKLYDAANSKDIVGLSIATRPDCLSDDVMILLTNLSKITNLWVELGLQTSNDNTAESINRCYTLHEYDRAIDKLRTINAHIITHIIFGLPGETEDDMLNTVKYVRSKTDGVKLQLMYVLKNTKLATLYSEGSYQPLSIEQYCEILCKAVRLLPDSTVIHRITGDPPKRELIAPMWSANKKYVLSQINKSFLKNEIKHKSV